MENIAEALKIAFAILLFVMALTLSISSFSQANAAVKAVVEARDRETLYEYASLEGVEEQYVYVEPTSQLTRTVGIEAVVSTINRAITQNIEIHFLKSDGKQFEIYKDINNKGSVVGIVSYIDSIRLSSEEGFGTLQQQEEFIKVLLGGRNIDPDECGIDSENWDDIKEKYIEKLSYPDGLYNELKDYEFEEILGEYYKGTGTTKTKKVVITYVLKN